MKFFENKRNIKLLQFVISNTQNSDLECLSIMSLSIIEFSSRDAIIYTFEIQTK